MKKTILIDFDGVLHSYQSGWKGATLIPDGPTPGAIEWLRTLIHHGEFEPVIWTSRVHNDTEDGDAEQAIRNWLSEHGLSHEEIVELDITNDKRPAWLLLDDRALTFTGIFPALGQISTFKPWNKQL